MKNLIILLCLFFVSNSNAQEEYQAPRLHKTAIGKSGCYAYMPQGEIEFDLAYSPDSSTVYTGEITEGDFNYGIIVIKMKETVLATTEDRINMVESYLDYLKEQFAITDAAGYGEGHTMENYPDAVGVIDYWIDEDKDTWQIKGWVDSNTIGILMIYGPTEYPNFNVQQMYLDGFRFN